MKRALLFGCLFTFGVVPSAIPQASTYGQLTGTVRDAQGGVLPGTAVTLSGSEVMGEQSVFTEQDGSYRFRALQPGTYQLRFELAGFMTLERAGIIVTTGTTTTMNVELLVGGVAESLTVTGESPALDIKTTRIGGTFDETALQDTPSATDVWSVLAQSPGVRMRGFDVGGSHKLQQSGYESFGVRGQNKVVSDGVDSTEGTGGTGIYYDYYSVAEFQVSAGGADVEMTGPGASVVMTVKSGGNDFSGLVGIEYEGENMVSNNVNDDLAEKGFTGNPNLLFWELHADVGGPIVEDKAWFFGGYNHFKLDKALSGIDPETATILGIFDNFIGKITFEPSEADRIIGYSQWGRKQWPNRGMSTTRPFEASTDQDGWSWVHKAEWQRVWSSRAFSNLQVKHFGFGGDFFANSLPEGENQPRIDTATGRFGGSSGADAFFGRRKPQVSGQFNYYLPHGAGSHDLKFGFDWQIDKSIWEPDDFPIQYRDNSTLERPNQVDEIRLFSFPLVSDIIDTHFDIYAQDTWTPSDRLTLTLGVRAMRQHVHYSDSASEPALNEIFSPTRTAATSLLTWFNVAPRLGVSYDLTGNGKTVLKAYYGRFYFNVADTLSTANPSGFAFKQYKFLDQNQNGLYDGAGELGPQVFEVGGGEGTPVSPDLTSPVTDEVNFSIEHEVATDTSVRVSYVRKAFKNDYGEWNKAQQIPLREAGIPCGGDDFPCPLNPFSGEAVRVARVPDEAAFAQNTVTDNFPDADYYYETLQISARRRFNDRFFIQGNFDYQWRDELRSALNENQNWLVTDPLRVGAGGASAFWQNHGLDVPYRQNTTNWQGKLLARYVFPEEIATSVNFRVQSGWHWAPIFRTPVPGSGTQPLFLENIDNNRSDNVAIVDIRLEKGLSVGGRGRVAATFDVYNLLNSNPVTNFVLRTGSSFGKIIAALDPRAVKIGLRFTF